MPSGKGGPYRVVENDVCIAQIRNPGLRIDTDTSAQMIFAASSISLLRDSSYPAAAYLHSKACLVGSSGFRRHEGRLLMEATYQSLIGSDGIRTEALNFCFDAFSLCEPVSTSLENALTAELHRRFQLPALVSPKMLDLQCHGIREDVAVALFNSADDVDRGVFGCRFLERDALCQIRIDGAGIDSNDSDARLGQSPAKGLRQRLQGGL